MKAPVRGLGFSVGATTALLLALSAGGQHATASTAAYAAAPSHATASAPALKTAVTPNGQWTMYHHDNAHTGLDGSLPGAGGAAAGWVSPTLDGDVYGEPLVYNGLVYVATLNNSVYAINQTDGSVVWGVNLGAPQTGGWGCGNINPTGILGTGVLDPSNSRIYEVAFLHQYGAYFLFGLDLATGNLRLETEVSPNGFDWTIQQERGALAMSHDNTHVYVPFGGRAGDCGSYHGWVVGVPTSGAQPDELFDTGPVGNGIWSPGGVVVDNNTGKVFVTTGNGGCPSSYNLNDAVIRLSPTLGTEDYFAPADWHDNWSCNDQDLGSASTLLISPNLGFQAGKWGNGFLYNPNSLGGIDGQLFPTPSPQTYSSVDVCRGNHSDATFGSFAYAAPYVYLECNGNGIVALQVNTSTPSFSNCDATCAGPSWNAGGGTTFGPPIVAGGIVWAVDINGGGLYGFDAASGAQLYHSAGFGVTHFSTPSEAGSQIFVSAGTEVREFDITYCTGAGLTPSSTSQLAGSTIPFTATSTGCAAPRYEFWVQYPDGSWNLIRGWGGATFNWNTTGLAPGNYTVHEWVNARGTGHDAIGSASVTLTGCTSASLAPAGTTQPAGSVVNFTASSGGCPNPVYEFWVQYPDGSWNLARGWGGPTFAWDTTTAPAGHYTVHAWANQQGAAPTLEVYGSSSVTLTGCTSASVSPPSPSAPAGSTVAFTASSAGCLNPRYEFWVQYPDGSWNLKQGWGGASFNWDTTGLAPGSYLVHAWVNRSGTTWEAYGSATVTLTGCTSASVSPPSVTQAAGSVVALTASSGGCANPVYEFWVQYPNGSWNLARGWGAATFNWDTTGLAPGMYTVHAWANQQGAAQTLEVYGSSTVTLTGCATASLSPSNPSQGAGTTVALTAGSTGCPNPRYEFFVQYPSGVWYLKQGWGVSTFTWDTTGLAPGIYTVHVWVNNQGTGHDAIGSATVTLTGCTSASLIPSSGSAAAGTSVLFTASSAGCLSPVYEFWLQYPDGSWHLMRSFSATTTWTWNSTGFAKGTYTIHVWANNSGADTGRYEVIGSAAYSLS
ncbi:MAG TPA: PQQ-binding-like beta-propeller repeat protein [Candidatus Dormibacteraeota bacterium]|nr:PQQ-binding-like beta-propeller repeat protein [Candidatus Dormibacteraeota bacterium]